MTGLMAPCGRMSVENTAGVWNKEYIDFLRENDIYTIAAGPRWPENFKKICDYDEGLCAAATMYAQMVNDEALPVKVLDHYAQNSVNYRAQKYIKDYFYADSTRSELIDFGMIESKVAMWVGLWDQVCPISQAEYIREMASENISHFLAVPY